MVSDDISLSSACETLLENRAGAEGTQLHGISTDGDSFVYTGQKAAEWAGHLEKRDHTAAGNILAGKIVIEEMSRAFQEYEGPIEEKLLAALEAGDDAGGDKRGDNLSAALLVRGPKSSLCHNIRVDDPGSPIEGLWNAYETAKEAEQRDDGSIREQWGGEYPDSITNFEIKY